MADTNLLCLGEIVERVGRLVQDTDIDRTTVIKDGINIYLASVANRFMWPELTATLVRHQQMWTSSDLQTLQQGGILGPSEENTLPESLTSGYQAIDPGISQIIDMWLLDPDDITVQYRPDRNEPDEFQDLASANPEDTDVPRIWCVDSPTVLPYPLLKKATIRFVSDSASDLSTVRVFGNNVVEAIDVSNIKNTENTFDEITLSGTTAVDGLTYKKGWTVENVTVKKNNAGNIIGKFYNNSSASALTAIHFKTHNVGSESSVTRSVQHPRIRVHPNPDRAYWMSFYCKKRPAYLLSNDDFPQIPVSNYLVQMGAMHTFENMRRHDIAQMHMQHAEMILRDTIVEMKIGKITVASPRKARTGIKGYRSRYAY